MTFYILDTDHIRLHQRQDPKVTSRIDAHSAEELAVTAFTLGEQMRGRLAQLGQKKVSLQRFSDGCARALAGRVSGDTREALPARAQAHQLDRTHLKTAASAAYELLRSTAEYFCSIRVLPFDEDARKRYESLRSQQIRIGKMDLRIAAVVLGQDAVLVTRNRRDFEQVRDLQIEDWSR
jgi:tRNA(fMet)-specific endonuclease VapC